MDSNVQHWQVVMGTALGAAAVGSFIFAVLGKWLGGVWTTLLATVVAGVMVYPPIIGGSWETVFTEFKNDILKRILLAAIPFAAVSILLWFKRVPWFVRALFALVGPTALLLWVFNNYYPAGQFREFTAHNILPISGVIFAAWILIEPIAVRSPGMSAPFLITAITSGIAVLLLISVEKLVLDAVIPATASGAALAAILFARFKWKISFARGPVLLWLTMTGAFFAFMWFDAETLFGPYLIWIGAAIPLAWIPEIGPIHRMKPWKRELLRCVLIIVPIAIGSGIAYHKADQAGEMDGMVWPLPFDHSSSVHSPAPSLPKATPIASTIIPPTIT